MARPLRLEFPGALHYHLLVKAPDANLSKGMRQLNGVFMQSVKRIHVRVGHLFQGRFSGDADARLARAGGDGFGGRYTERRRWRLIALLALASISPDDC